MAAMLASCISKWASINNLETSSWPIASYIGLDEQKFSA